MPVCRSIARDNRLGRIAFQLTRFARGFRFLRRAMLRMVVAEQAMARGSRRMSAVLWDTFSGSAPYSDILLRMLHPTFLARLAWSAAASLWARSGSGRPEVAP
jgi:hypothetical protein